MATNPIQPGDPVTADIINSLVLDIAELNKTKAGSFSLSLASAGGSTGGSTSVSQKVYSKVISKAVNDGPPKNITWTFPKDTFKSAPNCWVQLKNTNTGTPYTAFNFMIVITSVSATSMTFQVRGKGFTPATHEFICFAADA
jgi:hypothetical protein